MKHSPLSAQPPEPGAGISRRDFLRVSTASAAASMLFPSIANAAGTKMQPTVLSAALAEPWAPHARAMPKTTRGEGAFAIASNGTRTCTGGWQWRFDDIQPGQRYELVTEVTHQDLAVPRDTLTCVAIWGAPKAGQSQPGALWEYLLPEAQGTNRLRFTRRIVAPPGARHLTVRASLRWTAAGKTLWDEPRVRPLPAVSDPAPVRTAVVTGTNAERRRQFQSAAENIEFYGRYCEEACTRDGAQLIVLPEVALQWGVRGHPIDLAVPAPGPETDAFAAIARRHRARLAVGMYERDGDAVYNSLVLINPAGAIEGRYRKVHLAQGEDVSGILPGDAFPVFNTELGRIGCNICMDTMVPESARMAALNGADVLLLPIMGDFRADRWNFGPPQFDEERWRIIMRAQALDNQFTLVVARNRSAGSCIIDRRGDFLAWNDGTKPFVTADVPRTDDYCSWNGSCFRDSAWQMRRPHLYEAFTDPAKLGGSVT